MDSERAYQQWEHLRLCRIPSPQIGPIASEHLEFRSKVDHPSRGPRRFFTKSLTWNSAQTKCKKCSILNQNLTHGSFSILLKSHTNSIETNGSPKLHRKNLQLQKLWNIRRRHVISTNSSSQSIEFPCVIGLLSFAERKKVIVFGKS